MLKCSPLREAPATLPAKKRGNHENEHRDLDRGVGRRLQQQRSSRAGRAAGSELAAWRESGWRGFWGTKPARSLRQRLHLSNPRGGRLLRLEEDELDSAPVSLGALATDAGRRLRSGGARALDWGGRLRDESRRARADRSAQLRALLRRDHRPGADR